MTAPNQNKERCRLEAMNEQQFQEFLTAAIPRYAQDKVKSGNWPKKESLKLSRKSFDELLNQGLATPHHYLFAIVAQDLTTRIGWLWLMVKGKEAWVYEIFIEEPYRGQGYGQKTMRLAEAKAKALKANRLLLHVFGYNQPARNLYEKLGYEITNVNMAKKL